MQKIANCKDIYRHKLGLLQTAEDILLQQNHIGFGGRFDFKVCFVTQELSVRQRKAAATPTVTEWFSSLRAWTRPIASLLATLQKWAGSNGSRLRFSV